MSALVVSRDVVSNSGYHAGSGTAGDRTPNPDTASVVLSQLSYGPKYPRQDLNLRHLGSKPSTLSGLSYGGMSKPLHFLGRFTSHQPNPLSSVTQVANFRIPGAVVSSKDWRSSSSMIIFPKRRGCLSMRLKAAPKALVILSAIYPPHFYPEGPERSGRDLNP